MSDDQIKPEGILVYVYKTGGGVVETFIDRDEPNYPEHGWHRLVPCPPEYTR